MLQKKIPTMNFNIMANNMRKLPLNQARTVHPLPIRFMINDDEGISPIPSPNHVEYTKSRKQKQEESPSWESTHQLNEETVERLEKLYDIPHSIYNSKEKYVIVFLGGISGLWSSISSPIYLPVLPVLQTTFHATEEQLNITVVVYSIFQGIAPVIFSNLSDRFGRRSIILVCLTIYMIANIGLAVNNTFTGLILLRCLQAFGISSTLSVASGVASDITTKSDRASFIGLSTGLSLLGQAFGALIGGMISTGFGWRGIFWFLAMAAGITFLVDYFLLPETARSIVGNGSSLPTKNRWITVAPVLKFNHFKQKRLPDDRPNTTRIHPGPFKFLTPFTILKNSPVYLTLIPASISYALWLMMLTTFSTSLSEKYGYSTSQIALAYSPSGIGGLAGSIAIGELLDWNYKRNYGHFQERMKAFKEDSQLMINNKIPKFNIFKARLPLTILPTILSISGSFIFGWSLQYKANVGLVLLASFMISFGAMNYLTISTTMLIDLFPTQLSGSSSCVNLTRCWFAAIFIALLSKMVQAMTVAGCYSFMAGLCSLSSLCVVYIILESDKWI